MMKRRFFRTFIWLFIVAMCFSVLGCAVGFYNRDPKDVKKIKVLSGELEELRKAKSQLEQQLQKEIARGDVEIQLGKRGLVVSVVDSVLFNSGKAKLTSKGKVVLAKVAKVLSRINKDVAIEGHTDNVVIKFSGWKSNWELSSHRALSVLHYFVDEKKLNPEKFSATGYGPYKPIASNDTEKGRQKNRRVEIIILSQEIRKSTSPANNKSGIKKINLIK